jgi:hypothetical protein
MVLPNMVISMVTTNSCSSVGNRGLRARTTVSKRDDGS